MIKCPKCGYVRRPEDTAPDYQCPACDVVYAKVQPAQPTERPAAAATPAPQVAATPRPQPTAKSNLAACEDCGGKVSRKASSCVHCGRPFGEDEPAATSPVSVVDVRMDFMSMVFFMVKWAIATIPAIIILITIGVFVMGIIGGAMMGPRGI